jgi:hypothetical protein
MRDGIIENIENKDEHYKESWDAGEVRQKNKIAKTLMNQFITKWSILWRFALTSFFG